MTVKLYNCFHDNGSIPDNKYLNNSRPALLCGADLEEFRNLDKIPSNILRDNTGDNISSENQQYSELTGYYWIWKNDTTSDIIGIEHYRRHFIKHIEIENNDVKTSDLLSPEDIISILDNNIDFIIPVHESLFNTSIYDLYEICFPEQAKDMVKYMKMYFINNNLNNYLDAFYNYLSHNTLVRANMIITSRSNFNDYCNSMFNMIDFLKEHMLVKENSRVWGYITELFPMIYINANNKSYKEIDIAVDDIDFETKINRLFTTVNNHEEEFNKDPEEQIKFFKDIKI